MAGLDFRPETIFAVVYATGFLLAVHWLSGKIFGAAASPRAWLFSCFFVAGPWLVLGAESHESIIHRMYATNQYGERAGNRFVRFFDFHHEDRRIPAVEFGSRYQIREITAMLFFGRPYGGCQEASIHVLGPGLDRLPFGSVKQTRGMGCSASGVIVSNHKLSLSEVRSLYVVLPSEDRILVESCLLTQLFETQEGIDICGDSVRVIEQTGLVHFSGPKP